jgi:hypothetical protein
MTYTEWVEFCGDERKAYLPYQDLTEHALTEKVIELMGAKERIEGPATINYFGGIRRDTLRG